MNPIKVLVLLSCTRIRERIFLVIKILMIAYLVVALTTRNKPTLENV
jgi:hypothetical protein